MADYQHIVLLFQRRLKGELLSAEEEQILNNWAEESVYTREVAELFSNEERFSEELKIRLAENYREQWNRLREMINGWPSENSGPENPVIKLNQIPTRSRHSWITGHWARYAAAVIILLTVAITYYFIAPKSETKPSVSQTLPPVKNISPGSNKAILTLSDGKKIELSNATSETISDGLLSIENHDGQLSYLNPAHDSNPLPGGATERLGHRSLGEGDSEEGVGVTPAGTNTMTTPRGGQYQLTLSDGTKVWLNAASSITYPTAFTSTTREVKITGEAYFEVTRNKEKPFIVKTASYSPSSPFEKGGKGDFEKGGHDDAPERSRVGDFPGREISILVLGTSFNVNSYSDESGTKISLAEGAVKIQSIYPLHTSASKATTLQPGAAWHNEKVFKTNIEQDIAWKNGYFNFTNADLRSVMRQLARWYDIEVKYDGPVKNLTYQGELSRDLNLSQIIEILREMHINFSVDGRTLTVHQD